MSTLRIAPWLTADINPPTAESIAKALTPVRACGECLKCCKLVPVASIDKPANTWCRHARLPGSQGGHGCEIYAKRPEECRLWSCLWLLDPSFDEDLRPDKSHVVFDMMTDQVKQVDEQGRTNRIEVVQLWCDPHHRDAHRAPAVRAMIEMIAQHTSMPTLVRFSASDGFLVLAPPLGGGKWIEMRDKSVMGQVA